MYGDTRKIHINAIASDSNNNKNHVAQDMTFVILDFNHDDLVEQIGEKMKAAVTIQCREVLGNNGTSEQVYYWGDKHTSSDQDNYLNTPMRTWMNRNFIQALPTTLQPLIKEVIKKNLSTHKGYSIITTRDKAFWLGEYEVFGIKDYTDDRSYLEGEQYPYYKTIQKRIKYPNNNGNAKGYANWWWLRTPWSGNGYTYACVMEDGDGYVSSSEGKIGNAPAFCL